VCVCAWGGGGGVPYLYALLCGKRGLWKVRGSAGITQLIGAFICNNYNAVVDHTEPRLLRRDGIQFSFTSSRY